MDADTLRFALYAWLVIVTGLTIVAITLDFRRTRRAYYESRAIDRAESWRK